MTKLSNLVTFGKKGFVVTQQEEPLQKNYLKKKGGGSVKMRAPKLSTWLISVILAVLGILLYLGNIRIPLLAPYNFWLVSAAFILLALGSIIKGL